MKTTLNLDETLIRRAKEHALERGTTLTSLVEEALRDKLLPPQPGHRFRLDLPVVAGHRPSAVDPADRDALYHLIDAPG